ncbi:hypothetical protein HZA97_07780 [Candidatus Woesearchaeota archaeon]|nr:hypothetical protein [Candidatus Woesearchaeota archaeon]
MDPQTTVLYFKVETNDATHYFAARDWGAVKNLVNSPAVKWNEQNLFASGKETVKENAPFFANFEKANYELASDGLYSLGVVSKKTFQTKFRW